jgi:hypothetical protein
MSNTTEAKARIKINKLLEEAGWRFFDTPEGKANILLESQVKFDELGDDFQGSKGGFIDFLLLDEMGTPLAELFGVTVCTPNWLLEHRKGEKVILIRNYFIVFEYNFFTLKDRIIYIINGQTGQSWEEIANKLSRYFSWEYQDFEE